MVWEEVRDVAGAMLKDSRHAVGASLVAQWLRIHLPMQGTRFEPWSGKIPRAVEPLSPRATTTEPARHNY